MLASCPTHHCPLTTILRQRSKTITASRQLQAGLAAILQQLPYGVHQNAWRQHPGPSFNWLPVRTMVMSG